MPSKTKHVLVESELKKLQDKIEKLQHIVKIFFINQSYFFNDGAQLYFIFHTFYCTLKRNGNTEKDAS